MRNTIDLRRMRYIVEVARCEAITAAANVLAISQPALTRNIADVETELGVQLFHRLPRGIQLTEEGKLFVARAKQILGEVDNLVAEITESSGAVSGKLKVGFVPGGYIDHARPVVENLVREFPDISLELHTGSAQSLCPRLLHGDLHVIVGANSYLKVWRELTVREIKPLAFACVFRKDHPLSRKKHLTEIDVLRCPAIFPTSVEPLHSDMAGRFSAHHLGTFAPKFITDDNRMILQFLAGSDAYLPVMDTEESLKSMSRDWFLVRNVMQIVPHYISLASTPHRPKTRLIEYFETSLANHLAAV